MSLFADTSVWSLALRRDEPASSPEIEALRRALERGSVVTTGLVLQELLQGFPKPQAHAQITTLFVSLPMLMPTFEPPKSEISAAEKAFRSARSMRCLRSFAFITTCRC